MKYIFTAIVFLFGMQIHAQNTLIGYLHNWNSQDVAWVHPLNMDSRYSVMIVAFAMPASNTDMTMSFTPENMTQLAFKQAIAQLKSQGKKVLISIGGATAYLDFPDDAAKTTFVNSMNAIMDYYEFDGIDIDIEHGNCILITGGTITNPSNSSQVRLIDAMKTIMNHHRMTKNKKMYLTMAPETAYVQGGQSGFGSIWGGYLPLIHALRDSIDILQVQLYNSGTMYGIDGKVYAQGTADFIIAMTEAVIQGFPTAGGPFIGLPPSKVAIGLPACTSAAGGGYVDTATVSKAMNYLLGKGSKPGSYTLTSQSGYPTLKGMMTWSINWDAKEQCNGAYSFATMYERVFGNTPQLPIAVTMLAPNYGQIMVEDTVTFRWNKQPNAVYHIELLRGGTIIKSDSTLVDTMYRATNLEFAQLHTWKVRAKNAQGWGQWSSPWTFTSRALPIPSQVIPIAPENYAKVKKDSMIVFKWKKANNNVTSYTLTIQKQDSIIHRKSNIQDTSYTYAISSYDATYKWSVQAINPTGTGMSSDARTITSLPKPLDLPSFATLIEPLATEVRNDTIRFIWKQSRPSVETYHLRILFDNTILFEDSNVIDTMYILAMPKQSGLLRWGVRAFNTSGFGLWSMSDSIRYNRLPDLPKTPRFIEQADTVFISTDTMTIGWTDNNDAESYEVNVLHADSQFKHDTILNRSFFTMRNLKNTFTYELRVRALNDRGNSNWSTPLILKVNTSLSSVQDHISYYSIIVHNGIMHLQTTQCLPIDVDIYGIDGTWYMSAVMTEMSQEIPLFDIPSGLYFVRFGTSIQTIVIQ